MKRFCLILASIAVLSGCDWFGSGGGGAGQDQPKPIEEWTVLRLLRAKLKDVHVTVLDMQLKSKLKPDQYKLVRGWHLYRAVADVGGINEADLDTPKGSALLYQLMIQMSEPTGFWKKTIDVELVARKLMKAFKEGDNL